MPEENPHIKALEGLLDSLVRLRRSMAEENSIEKVIKCQESIEVIERAIEHEKKLVSPTYGMLDVT